MWINRNSFVTAGLVVLTIAGTTIAATGQAEARNNFGRGLAAGIAGTILGGALIAGASQPAYAAPRPVYGPPVVYEPAYPVCHVVWRQDGYGDMYRARVCN
ncbi:hypothetical protein SAMN05880582_1011542 [Rhizobium sp. RU20A]|uniref:hypothetical protein n=1 Tax=Rhizobium sp. RU20A TaxID=1907412 RepID=UPI0009566E45|nr:hypothetical protein [Rhizobium sp. RU20A]SIQ34390.1 hypothetical protein SAMN05880582_1011542 [Rhizobium sp. RU20A]